jgi:hypothetical protein
VAIRKRLTKKSNPDRMDGDLLYCSRCGAVVLGRGDTGLCLDCVKLVSRFMHGLTYLVMKDPTDTYTHLGHHKDPTFSQSLHCGYFPEGMIVEVWNGGDPSYVGKVMGAPCPPDLERAPAPQYLTQIGGARKCRGDGVYLTQGRK